MEKSLKCPIPTSLKYKLKLANLSEAAKNKRELKFKDQKAHKFTDLFAEAFPTSSYLNIDQLEKETLV